MSQTPTPEASPDQAIHQQSMRRAALRGLLVYGLFMLVAAGSLLLGAARTLPFYDWLLILMPGLAAAMVQPPGSAWARRITAALLATAGAFVGGFIILLGMVAQQAREDLGWLSVTAGIGFGFIGFTSAIVHGLRAAFASALAFGLAAFCGSILFGISRSWYFILMPSFVILCGGPVLGIMAASASLPPGFATRRQLWKLAGVTALLVTVAWSLAYLWIHFQAGRGDAMDGTRKFQARQLQHERIEEEKRGSIKQALDAERQHAPPLPFPVVSNPEFDPLR